MTLLAAILLKGSILIIAAAAAVALLFRASAATRHFIWTITLAGLLVLPLFSMTLPPWTIAVRIVAMEARAAVDGTQQRVSPTPVAPAAVRQSAPPGAETGNLASDASSQPFPWVALLGGIYAFAALLLFGRLLTHHSSARRVVRESSVVTDPEWASLLADCAARVGVTRRVGLHRNRVQLMPVTTGTLSPSIVIPADADTWDGDRRRSVLLHELAHIARHDSVTQLLSSIACAVYWFHPGVWYVARRLRIERELACDDRVVSAGAHAEAYAGHLLELAYSWSGRRAPALAIGMASSRKLEGRMRAILDPARNRTTPSRRMWIMGAALGAAVLLPLAALTMTTASADARSRLMAASAEQDLPSQQKDPRSNATERLIDSTDAIAGAWEISPARNRDSVRITISAGAFSSNGEIPWSQVDGLTSPSLSETNGPVRFSVSRDAGTLEVEGTLANGSGSGVFRFVPSERFTAGLTQRGFTRPTTQQLFALAQNDIGVDFVDELTAHQYERPDIDDLVRAAHHGVGTDFVREMAEAGYRLGTLDTLIRFRDHGVDPEYVRDMRARGMSGLAPEDLVRARDHGVDPEYVADLASLGYDRQPFEALLRARDHGVDGEYLRGLRQLGYRLTIEEAIRARDHGVDPEFAGGMRTLGQTLTIDELIRARDHGVEPGYVAAMAAEGYKDLPIETLLRLRDHGVTPDYVQDMRKRGRDRLSPDEIIRLRDNGVGVRSFGLNYRWDRLLDRLARELDQAIEKLRRHIG
jgi:beta-lactamase regulating signal transducer with metallopeptidase domain